MRLGLVFFALMIVVLVSQFSIAADKVETVGQKTGKAIDSTVATSKATKEQIQAGLEESFEVTKQRIAELKEDAKTAKGSVKKDLDSQIAKIEHDQEALSKKISDLKKSSGKAWEHLKDGAGSALQKLKDSYQKAKDEFNKRTDS